MSRAPGARAPGRLRLLAASGACLVALSVVVTASPATASPAVTVNPAAAGQAAPHQVTLITGDQVSLAGQEVSVIAADRRQPVVFHKYVERGDVYVVPEDAVPAVESGTVDRELFNVTGLTRQGVTGELPLIVTGGVGARAGLPAAARHVRALPSINGAAVKVEPRRAAELWAGLSRARSGALRVWLDQRLKPSLGASVPQVGAPQAWQAGFDGTGVEVAVLDTGIDIGHPDLADRIVEARSFAEGDEDPGDVHGHGTHVASTIAGSGKASNGKYKGVAPGAKIRSGRVCEAADYCSMSAVLAGMDWAAHSGARVINMSLGGYPTDGSDLLSQRVNELSAETRVLFVIAAGNAGCVGCVGAPGAAEAALTVGAVDKTDQLAGFSSRGPRWGNAGAKPELVAPGVSIMAARAQGMLPGYPGDARYVGMSGTSMATPHVAGAAAILAQARPAATGPELKDPLVSTGKDLGLQWFEQGAGRLDVPAALTRLSASASVNFGLVTSPGTKQITYTNRGQAPVTLRLGLPVKGWDGSSTDAARLSVTELAVPAGGQSSVDVTVDPGTSKGVFGGVVTATADGVSLRTPISWRTPYPPLPRHTLTISMLDHEGTPLPDEYPNVVRDAPETEHTPNDPFVVPEDIVPRQVRPGTWTADVPQGTYSVVAEGWSIRPGSRRVTLLAVTDVNVDRNAAVTLDARTAVRASARTPQPTHQYNHQLTYELVDSAGRGFFTTLIAANGQHAELYATPVAAPKRGRLSIQENYTLGARTVRASVGGAELPVGHEPYAVARALTGRHTLTVADADSPDLTGKAALVTLAAPDPNDLTWWVTLDRVVAEAATAAQRKGAVVLIPYLDVPGAAPWYPHPVLATGLYAHRLPILSVSHTDGLRLRASGGPLRLDVKANPAYTYNLHYAPPPGIPADLTHRVDPAQLKKTRHRYHSDVPDVLLHTWTVAFENGRNTIYSRPEVNLQGPAEVDQYVGGATGNQSWRRQAHVANQKGQFFQVDFQPWRGIVEDWFSGPLSIVARDQDDNNSFLRWALPDKDLFVPSRDLGDGSPGHTADTLYESMTYRLLSGSTEIPNAGAPYLYRFEIPTTRATYRLEGSYVLPDQSWYGPSKHVRTHSPRVDSTWTFTTASPTGPPCFRGPSCSRPPLLQLRYQLGLDLDNRAKARRPHLIQVHAYPQQASTEGGRIAGLTLLYSTDAGATWKKAPTFGYDGRYLAVLPHHAPAGTAMWLKTEAWDTKGNRITQTVHHAYTLR